MPIPLPPAQIRTLRLGPALFFLAGLIGCVFFLGNWSGIATPDARGGALHSGPAAGFFVWLVVYLALAAILLSVYYRRLNAVLERATTSERDESRLSAAMQTTLGAVFMYEAVRDDKGTIVDFTFNYVNPTGESMIGRSRESLEGRSVFETYPDSFREGRLELYRKVVETAVPLTFETSSTILNANTGRDSSIFRIQAVKMGDGLLITCVDITVEQRTTQELKRSLAFNRAVVASSSFAMVIMDLDGTVASINPAAETMLGFTEDELTGQNITVLHDPSELIEVSRRHTEELGRPVPPDSSVLRARLASGLEEDREWTYISRNKLRIPVQVSVNAIEDGNGAIIAYMASSYDLTDRKQTDKYIYHIAHHDPLTGLPGRILLRDHIETAIKVHSNSRMHFAVLIFDLDQFKRINDSLGHETGDLVLREVAFRLRAAVRHADTVARFGDQFVVILNELTERVQARTCAQGLRDVFGLPFQAMGHQITLSASVGISLYPDTADADELLKHADIALDHGKAQGRNGLAVFTPDLSKRLLERLNIETALRKALANNELFLVYQPQISLTNHTLVGVEALIRWRHPDTGLVMPSLFIPIAEETGLIIDIGAWCLETACREIADLQREVGYKLSVAVNLSPNQVHGVHFQQTIERALAVSGLPPESLEVEITEGLLMRDSEETLQIIEGIQALGVTTAIDDFGTGFSNMSYITRFKVDRLKIDRSFVSKCLTDANSLAVTTAIIALAHSLNMEVIAEGVETVEQATMLRDLECDSAQGYLYSRPLSLADVRTFTQTLATFGTNHQSRSEWMYQPHSAA